MNGRAIDPHYDIVTVGGGPAGSVASLLLAQAGFKVLLMDAQKTRGRKVCGEFLCREGVEILKKLQLQSLLQNNHFLPALGAKIVTNRGTVISGRFPQHSWNQPGGYCLDRGRFDAALLDEAQRHGTQLLLGQRVIAVSQLNAGWRIKTQSGKMYTCDLLIGADGIRSTMARLLSLTRNASEKRVAFRCFLPTRTKNQRRIEIHLLKRGYYIGLDAVSDDSVNFSILVDSEEMHQHGSKEKLIRFYYDTHPELQKNMLLPDVMPPIEAISPVRHTVRSCIANNAVLIGDAGGFIEPLTGDGMTIALWTAVNMAKQLIDCKQSDRWARRNEALVRYASFKERHYLQKKIFTHSLCWLIRRQAICDFLCTLVKNKPVCIETFMGVINHTYPPLSGTLRIILSAFSSSSFLRQAAHSPDSLVPNFCNNQIASPYPDAAEATARRSGQASKQGECLSGYDS
jgi:flavin-dependent dehydrogenase